MKLRILKSAKRDLEEGRQFYEIQDAALGDYFITSVEADIDGLRIYAGIHPVAYKKFHRALCRVVPFAIYYLKSGNTATIYAIIDCRRDPAWIRQHLEASDEQPRHTGSEP
jgi:hypothetical protein